MLEQSRNERKLLAIERAKRKLQHRLSDIDWEFDYLKPRVAEFKAQARLPELPAETIVEIIDETHATHPTSKSTRPKGARLRPRK